MYALPIRSARFDLVVVWVGVCKSKSVKEYTAKTRLYTVISRIHCKLKAQCVLMLDVSCSL